MNEHEIENNKLAKEVAKWKNRALEACEKACFNCEEYMSREKGLCSVCRIWKIQEEAGK